MQNCPVGDQNILLTCFLSNVSANKGWWIMLITHQSTAKETHLNGHNTG